MPGVPRGTSSSYMLARLCCLVLPAGSCSLQPRSAWWCGHQQPAHPSSTPLPACPAAAFNHILTDVSLVVYQFEAIAGFSGMNGWL